MIVDAGAVPALVKHLGEPSSLTIEGSEDRGERPCEHEVEKGSAFALGLLAVKVPLFNDITIFCENICLALLKFCSCLSVTA